ncbi:peptidoglycan D,D-transpeptidase FtsI family protein [Parablautia sp. Marseille-Q6255]|uniref:peptidoglycan D,D-transpeptidase FtsI family protein n=1 Tax=Parablautia sp. Marseille-Q6255 TaxID=3039593 RepID=UPI0024BC0FFE|nr:penicillin-binding transpeptidase domain-containing protein [Parablautia sp. Marseille-Q6255]
MARGNRTKKERRFTRKMQIKLLAVFAFILLCLILILMRIVYINVHSGKRYAKQVLSQENYDSQTLYSRRGEIQDANGRLLAYSEKVYNLVLDCKAVNQEVDGEKIYIEPTIDALTAVFEELDAGIVRDVIVGEKTCDSQYQVLLEKVTEDQKDAYEAYVSLDADREISDEQRKALQKVTGVWFEEEFVRRYPLDTVASTVIGFSNSVGDGIAGLEAYYDTQLKGTNGRVFGYLNENQEYERKTIPPQNGYTLQTTLDVNVQEIVEKYIAEFDEAYGTDNDNGTAKHGAKNVGVMIMDPNTGSVLAMATNSGYNLNDPQNLEAWYTQSEIKAMTDEQYVEALNSMWKNFCVSDGIEPGSTFKPVTISAALECGAVTENDSFYCDSGEQVTDTYIRCDAWPNAHGDETLGDVLKNSCNDGLMAVGRAMGVSRFIEYQTLFNFGRPTGIDLPNEASGAVYTQETMNEVELATCTFGQGLTCTMVQQAAAFAAVINGGYYYQPHLVDKIFNEDGKLVRDSSGLLLKQTISGDVSETMRGYLETAVKEGTGRRAQVPGYRIGGKTGTAEKIDPETGRRAEGKYLVSFIGAAPINDPEVIIYVVVDEPNVDNQANSTYAQEIYQKIATEVLPYLGIYPTEDVTPELLASLGLEEEDLGEEVVKTFQAYDSYGTLHQDARVEGGQVINGAGAVVEGATIAEDGTVYDAYMNPVSTVEVDQTNQNAIDPKTENPGIALPPSENDDAAEDTTVWDATAVEDDGEDTAL